MKSFIILGNHQDLSLLETETVLKTPAIESNGSIAFFDTLNHHPEWIVQRLAGVIKTGDIIDIRKEIDKESLGELLAAYLVGSNEKVRFGISIYNLDNQELFDQLQGQREHLGLTVKKHLKRNGTQSRFVISRNTQLSAADIVKNKLLIRGGEFVLIATKKGIMIGQTSAVQHFEDWSIRDFGRPARDAKRGMLPPKLARMMLNISGKNPKESTILDPFCGVGTVLMEASLLDFKHIIGSDIDPKAIKDTKKNMRWVMHEFDVHPQLEMYTSSAQNIPSVLEEQSVDVMIFEPFLGKPRKGHETRDDIVKQIKSLQTLYTESFIALRNILKDDGIILATIPVHYFENEPLRVKMNAVLRPNGFERAHETLHYRQNGQYVGRDITIIRKN